MIRWVGVVVALAGVLIATPDGTAWAWRRIAAVGNWARRRLARYLWFLRKDVAVQGVTAEDVMGATDRLRVQKRVRRGSSGTSPRLIQTRSSCCISR